MTICCLFPLSGFISNAQNSMTEMSESTPSFDLLTRIICLAKDSFSLLSVVVLVPAYFSEHRQTAPTKCTLNCFRMRSSHRHWPGADSDIKDGEHAYSSDLTVVLCQQVYERASCLVGVYTSNGSSKAVTLHVPEE